MIGQQWVVYIRRLQQRSCSKGYEPGILILNAIDHIVIGAATLEEGVDFVQRHLGVHIPFGGVHKTMGTHNHLMQLGESAFLEVIAVNPDIAAPDHARWYGLDDPFVRAQLDSEPRLLTWVVNTPDMHSLFDNAGESFGEPVKATRGNLSWLFGLPADGRLLAGGLLPYVIEWHCDEHPASLMADTNCTLKSIEIDHPNPHWLRSRLQLIDASELVKVNNAASPVLKVSIESPVGMVELHSIQVEKSNQRYV